jgi:hypothetical protein
MLVPLKRAVVYADKGAEPFQGEAEALALGPQPFPEGLWLRKRVVAKV